MADHLSTNVLHIFCSLRDESDEGRESHVTFSLKLDCLRYSFTVSAQSWMNPFLRNRKTFMDFLYWDIFPCLHHGNSSERQQSCISLNSQFNISSSSKHGGTKIRGYNKSIWRTSWSNRYYVVTLKGAGHAGLNRNTWMTYVLWPLDCPYCWWEQHFSLLLSNNFVTSLWNVLSFVSWTIKPLIIFMSIFIQIQWNVGRV